ncbi:MAG: hypothetical protein AMXMBFR68_17360 [Ignavibacteria bacterium]
MQRSRPLFSVVICTWNRAHLLPRALNSLLTQTWSDWEAIVVDDAGTDSTSVVVQNYMERDPRLLYHRVAQQGGTAAARNTGILLTSGDWVTFLDSDDEYLPSHLEKRMHLITDIPGADLFHGGFTVIGNPYVRDKDNPGVSIHLDSCVVGGTFVIRRDVFRRVGLFPRIPYADDAEFFERCRSHGLSIERCTAATYVYHRDTPGQLTG